MTPEHTTLVVRLKSNAKNHVVEEGDYLEAATAIVSLSETVSEKEGEIEEVTRDCQTSNGWAMAAERQKKELEVTLATQAAELKAVLADRQDLANRRGEFVERLYTQERQIEALRKDAERAKAFIGMAQNVLVSYDDSKRAQELLVDAGAALSGAEPVTVRAASPE